MISLYPQKGSTSVYCFLLGFLLWVTVVACGDKSPTDSDGQDKWVPSNTGLEELALKYLAIQPNDANIIFAGTWDGLYKSTNGAQTWARVDSGWSNTTVTAIAFDSQDADIMYVGTHGAGVFKSEDGGKSWKDAGESWDKRNPGLVDPTIYGVATDPIHPDTFFVGCEGGICRSYDGADTLAKVYWYGRAFLAFDPQDPQKVYAGGKHNNFHKSIDGGEEWVESNTGLPQGSGERRIQWILIDPVNPNIMYVASNNIGVYKSTVAGGDWTEKNVGLWGAAKDVRVLALDFSNTEHLYAATNNGVFQSTDGAETWQPMSEGLTNLNVTALAVDPRHPRILYVGTWGDGVFLWKGQ